MTLTVELAWPSSDLKQNGSHGHWSKVSRARKQSRQDAFWITRAAMGAQLGPTVTSLPHDGSSDVLLRQVAHPPDRRHRDRDGVDACLKSARDGISDAVGINDRFFRPTGIEWGSPVNGGKIVIYVEVPSAG